MSDLILVRPFFKLSLLAKEFAQQKTKIIKEAMTRILRNNFFVKNKLIICTLILLIITTLMSAKLVAQDNYENSINELEKFNLDLKNYNSKLTISDNKNNIIASFDVAKAITQEQKIYGLMNLKSLPEKYGMIFIFNESKVVNMWMKNTNIALDMIFIDKENTILNISHNNNPNSLEIISSVEKVDKVLEINAGLAKKLKIKIGQKIKIN
jgi:uncharacterized protein